MSTAVQRRERGRAAQDEDPAQRRAPAVEQRGDGDSSLTGVADGGDPSDEPRIGRAVLRGAIAGFLLVTALASLLGLANGLEGGSALALGAFAGLWGGSGFGGMLGAIVVLMRSQEP